MRPKQIVASVLTVLFCTAAVAWADGPVRFQFRRGQVLQYRVEQTSSATDSLGDLRTTVSTRVEQVKDWHVVQVEPDGTAVVQLSVSRLKVQHRLPSGEVWEYDSAAPEASAAALREKLAPFVGKPLAVFRIDPWGRVVESRTLSPVFADRFVNELPFTICLASRDLQPGQTWSRSFRRPVTSPTGSKSEAELEQQFQVRSIHNGQVVIAFATQIQNQPGELLARLPLLQCQPTGEAIFDMQLGQVVSARYVSGGVIEGHQGEGSRYEFSSECRETLIGQ
ncbi:MAG: hypothetical protein NZM31_12420 [Gemmatales bacterium]|nr:hypothetical protein [Gemmatales bacterium]MDW8387799.1 hypothetical protein [Gemmatales bacterium]